MLYIKVLSIFDSPIKHLFLQSHVSKFNRFKTYYQKCSQQMGQEENVLVPDEWTEFFSNPENDELRINMIRNKT